MSDTHANEFAALQKEYDTLRCEILERIKISFSHLGYIGAIIAFAFPFAKDVTGWHVFAAILGLGILALISIINWSWVRLCAQQIQEIEQRMSTNSFSQPLLTWESKAALLTRGVFCLPRKFISYTSPELVNRINGQSGQTSQ